MLTPSSGRRSIPGTASWRESLRHVLGQEQFTDRLLLQRALHMVWKDEVAWLASQAVCSTTGSDRVETFSATLKGWSRSCLNQWVEPIELEWKRPVSYKNAHPRARVLKKNSYV